MNSSPWKKAESQTSPSGRGKIWVEADFREAAKKERERREEEGRSSAVILESKQNIFIDQCGNKYLATTILR